MPEAAPPGAGSPAGRPGTVPSHPNAAGPAVTPALVQKIADEVYARLQRELLIERERARRQP